jgi:hypothetical protein
VLRCALLPYTGCPGLIANGLRTCATNAECCSNNCDIPTGRCRFQHCIMYGIQAAKVHNTSTPQQQCDVDHTVKETYIVLPHQAAQQRKAPGVDGAYCTVRLAAVGHWSSALQRTVTWSVARKPISTVEHSSCMLHLPMTVCACITKVTGVGEGCAPCCATCYMLHD